MVLIILFNGTQFDLVVNYWLHGFEPNRMDPVFNKIIFSKHLTTIVNQNCVSTVIDLGTYGFELNCNLINNIDPDLFAFKFITRNQLHPIE